MSHKYSPSTKAFYETEAHRNIPDDAVDITDEVYADLFVAQADVVAAKAIIAGTDGKPVAVDPETLPQSWKQWQNRARAALAANDRTAQRCIKAGVPYTAAWLAYDGMLRAILRAADDDSGGEFPQPPKNQDGSVAYPAGT